VKAAIIVRRKLHTLYAQPFDSLSLDGLQVSALMIFWTFFLFQFFGQLTPFSLNHKILRYQHNQAYIQHHDYLETNQNADTDDDYDYDSAGYGGNRFATILLYFTDLEEEEGGQTVFEHAWPHGTSAEQKAVPDADIIIKLRKAGELDMLQEGSWEEEMIAKCRTRLRVQPKAGRAVLFYSQYPDGRHDKLALHGACPVVHGTKWVSWKPSSPLSCLNFSSTSSHHFFFQLLLQAANLWVS